MTSGQIFVISLFAATTFYNVDGYSRGAPIPSCFTMTPGHGASAQTSPAPYTIQATNLNNGNYRVKLEAKQTYFTGFLVRAKRGSAESGSSSGTSVYTGTFTQVPSDFAILDCGTEKASAVTHTNNTKKRSVEVDWQPPAGYEGPIVFVATFVHSFQIFWVRVESLPIRVGKRTAREQIPNRNDEQLNAALLSVYDGCGLTKNCLSYPVNCDSARSCDGLVSILYSAGEFEVEMFAKGSLYVAVGFSTDQAMGGDYVVECAFENNGVNAHRSRNEPNRKANSRLDDDAGVSLVKGLYADGAIYCKVRLAPVSSVHNENFDLNAQSYYLLLAAGTKLKDNRPGVGYHDRFFTASQRSFLLTDVVPAPSQDSFYDGCSTIKTCFGVPEGCVDRQNCQAVTAVNVQGKRFIFSMLARGAAYVATGLSEDLFMQNDLVVECVQNGNNVDASLSWNVPNRKDNERLGTRGITLQNGSVKDNVLQCSVVYDPKEAPHNFKYDQPYYLLLAAGRSINPDKIGFHDLVYQASTKQVMIPSSQKVDARKADAVYAGCDRTKGCFGEPNDCVNNQNCKILVSTLKNYYDQFVFEMMAQESPAYVAVGLSDDRLMGDDAVFECVRDDQNDIRAHMSWNVGGRKANERVQENYLSLVNKSYVDGKFQCTVLLQNPQFTLKGKNFNVATNKYYLLIAAGSEATPAAPGQPGKVGYHDIGKVAAAEARFVADVSPIRGASKLLLHLHGSFMVASWIGLASFGIVIARYYKDTWRGSSCFGKDIWFFWHRTSMFLTWLLTIVGVVLIYIYSGGLISGTPGETHMWLGFVTTFLAFMQPIGALFRPSPGSSRRPIFNWCHWLFGNSAHILAIVTIFFAVDLSKAELPKWTDYILVAFVAYYVLAHLFLSIFGCLSDKSGGIRINAIQMKDMNSGRNMAQSFERQKDAAYAGARKFILTVHVLAILTLSVALIYLIVETPGR